MAHDWMNPHPAEVPLPQDDTLRHGIGCLSLSCRVYNALKRAGVVDLTQVHQGWGRISEVRGIGRAAVAELADAMNNEWGGIITFRVDGTTDLRIKKHLTHPPA